MYVFCGVCAFQEAREQATLAAPHRADHHHQLAPRHPQADVLQYRDRSRALRRALRRATDGTRRASGARTCG